MHTGMKINICTDESKLAATAIRRLLVCDDSVRPAEVTLLSLSTSRSYRGSPIPLVLLSLFLFISLFSSSTFYSRCSEGLGPSILFKCKSMSRGFVVSRSTPFPPARVFIVQDKRNVSSRHTQKERVFVFFLAYLADCVQGASPSWDSYCPTTQLHARKLLWIKITETKEGEGARESA